MRFTAVCMLILLILIVGFFVFAAISRCNKKNRDYGINDNEEVRKLAKVVSPSFILTRSEKPLFFLIQETLPEYILLTQVSFSAILKSNDLPTRNSFNRKRIDYLVVSKDFAPIVVIELDDRSHKISNVKESDEYRDNLLSAAGIPTIRFKELPSKELLKRELGIVLREFVHREKLPTYTAPYKKAS